MRILKALGVVVLLASAASSFHILRRLWARSVPSAPAPSGGVTALKAGQAVLIDSSGRRYEITTPATITPEAKAQAIQIIKNARALQGALARQNADLAARKRAMIWWAIAAAAVGSLGTALARRRHFP